MYKIYFLIIFEATKYFFEKCSSSAPFMHLKHTLVIPFSYKKFINEELLLIIPVVYEKRNRNYQVHIFLRT